MSSELRKIAVIGYQGRMGQATLEALAKHPKLTLGAKVGRQELQKSAKSSKIKKTAKPPKGKKQEVKQLIESFTSIPGVGAKSAKAFYEAGFKSTQDILSAKEEELLAVPGVGINLVKKLKAYKS